MQDKHNLALFLLVFDFLLVQCDTIQRFDIFCYPQTTNLFLTDMEFVYALL